ncbi:MAG: CDP-alcohol phosphatidyltransferase family protein [Stappiaceae bacterium]
MLDTFARKVIDAPLNEAGRALCKTGLSANAVTTIGLVAGIAAVGALAMQAWVIALLLILFNRLMDGLDGAVARATKQTDLGGYLDIVFDFFFYGGIPIGFVIADPGQNALAGAVLLFSFYANGSAFLAFAIIAQKRGLKTNAQGAKSLYYLGGLAEGTETIAVFCIMCLLPHTFAYLALGFAALCFISAGARVLSVISVLKETSG